MLALNSFTRDTKLDWVELQNITQKGCDEMKRVARRDALSHLFYIKIE